jgi:uncharacterized protein YdeI (YjbR/CyaY-like superfamily)
MKATYFATPAAFRKWLEKHHETEKELIVGFYKVNSGKPSITWPQSVDQALCFGWIDGVRRSVDDQRYCIRFTPRKPSSMWSAINIKKVEDLTKAGLMRAAGYKAFALRTENRSRVYSHEKEPAVLASEYVQQFKANKLAWKFFQLQPPSYKKVITHWIMTAKQEKTQLSRLEKAISISAHQKRMI